MKKMITLTVEFPDDFTPPDRFYSAYIHDSSKCERCPFYFAETYDPYDDCCCPSEVDASDECPIKKFF